MHTVLFLVFGSVLLLGIGLYDAWRKELACVSDLPPLAAAGVIALVGCLTWYDVFVPLLALIAKVTLLPAGSFAEVVVAGAVCTAAFGTTMYVGFCALPTLVVGRAVASNWSREESFKGFAAFVVRRAYASSSRLARS